MKPFVRQIHRLFTNASRLEDGSSVSFDAYMSFDKLYVYLTFHVGFEPFVRHTHLFLTDVSRFILQAPPNLHPFVLEGLVRTT